MHKQYFMGHPIDNIIVAIDIINNCFCVYSSIGDIIDAYDVGL